MSFQLMIRKYYLGMVKTFQVLHIYIYMYNFFVWGGKETLEETLGGEDRGGDIIMTLFISRLLINIHILHFAFLVQRSFL